MKYLSLLLLLLICDTATADNGDRRALIVANERMVADTDTIVRKRSISVGLSYGSDAMFFGRTGPVAYPFNTVDVVYNTKNGFFVYGTLLRLTGYNTTIDEVDIGGGYLFKPTKKYTGSISYTRFIFNKEQRIIESATNNDINFKNTFDWGLFRSTLSMDYLFGKSNDFFITIGKSKYIEPNWKLFADDDYLTFNPGVSMIVGTQNFVTNYSLDNRNRFIADNIFKSANAPFQYNNGRFNVLNYSFKLPIAYNRPHYTFEAAYRYSIPVNVAGSLMNKRESFLNLTFYYLFY